MEGMQSSIASEVFLCLFIVILQTFCLVFVSFIVILLTSPITQNKGFGQGIVFKKVNETA